MASMYRNRKTGSVSFQFFHPHGRKRKTIHIGELKNPAVFKQRLESVVSALATGDNLPHDVAEWLTRLGDDVYGKFVKAGLCVPRVKPDAVLLAGFIDAYIAGRTDLQGTTRTSMIQGRRRLVDFFGADRSLDSITPADADAFLIALGERGYAPATIGRTIRRAQQFFRAAIRRRLLTENPFMDVAAPAQTNRERIFMVGREMVDAVLEACPNVEWRALIALCRFGGLRCPSEALLVAWEDVDWNRGRLLVHSPKTKRHKGGEDRLIPLFPELRRYLEEAFEQAEEGAVFVVTRYRNALANLRTQFMRIVRRAGFSPWPRLFHNLRASCETELAATYPIHVVAAWMGHGTLIAAKHYLSVQDSDFDRAARGESAAPGAARALQTPRQPKNGHERQDTTEESEDVEIDGFGRVLSLAGVDCRNVQGVSGRPEHDDVCAGGWEEDYRENQD